MIPASAPWRSSPPSSRSRNVCSVSVAAANRVVRSAARRACAPLPDTAPISEKVASTAPTVSVAWEAGGGRERNAAQPTPIWRCRNSPDSQDTTIMTRAGSGAARASRSAMWATFLSRDDVLPTSVDAFATSRRSTVASLAWLGDKRPERTR
ncbi:hypothetical protein I550_4104 [Mycobacterium intracellulare 1956]|uniref:Uncharacterized protein n=1 Tax=Mycobacterium intracellulare 1956 TaxID=1299331 RepID=X8CHU6_MYCIT|nr:hypothetical protein I550_4104 [Mycobacterium intracellulare 1956]